MMKKLRKVFIGFLFLILAIILASIFIVADLRTTEIKENTQSEDKVLYAKNILQKAIEQQGFIRSNSFQTYEIIGRDHWKGAMGSFGNPWSWNNDQMVLRYSLGDFDGQVEVLEGDQKGFIAGIQSWNYYEKKNNELSSKVVENKGVIFILAAFHYFFELGPRLSQAPFIRYAGKGKLKGQGMEKVFVSWGNKVTKDYDQYLLWIGEESKLIEAVTFTTRDNFKPAPAFMYGSLRFDDFREVNGVKIPFLQTAYIGEPKESTKDYIHQLVIDQFSWDQFPVSDIRPFEGLESMGDDKPRN